MQRWWSTSWRAGLLAVFLASLAAAPMVLAESPRLPRPAHHLARGFRNLDPSYDYTVLGRTVGLLRRALQTEPDRGLPLTRVPNDGAALRANGIRPTVTWIGHATLLVQLDGVNILTDPAWSEQVGPLGFGPRRLVEPGLAFEDLPPIHVVLISHDHYDHLDLPTLERRSAWAPGCASRASRTWSSSTGGSATSTAGSRSWPRRPSTAPGAG
jgi:hypothetical protein